MSEPKMTHRIPPCAAYDIPGMERWLEEMAAKGWRLCYDGFFCGVASFEAAPPERLRFRLEATATKGGLFSEEYAPDDDAFQLNHQMGWDYRARRGQFHIYSAADPEAPELNTDPRIQAMTIDTLGKYLRKELQSSILLFLFYFLLYFFDMTLTAAVTLGSWRVGLVFGLFLWELGRKVHAIVRLSKLKRALEQSGAFPRPDSVPEYRNGAAQLARIAMWIFVMTSLLLKLGAGLVGEDTLPLERYTGTFPFSTLGELYPEGEVLPLSGLLDSDVTLWQDFLAPENYDYNEYAAVRFPDGTTQDCYLSVEYHRTRWDWVAAGIAREFVSQAGDNPVDRFGNRLFGEEPTIATKLDIPGVDYAAYYYKHRSSPYLVLQRGSVVLRVNLDLLGYQREIAPETLAQIVLSRIG